jgi:hypothetical protein
LGFPLHAPTVAFWSFHGDKLRVEAEAKSTAETVSVRLLREDTPAADLPEHVR